MEKEFKEAVKVLKEAKRRRYIEDFVLTGGARPVGIDSTEGDKGHGFYRFDGKREDTLFRRMA